MQSHQCNISMPFYRADYQT